MGVTYAHAGMSIPLVETEAEMPDGLYCVAVQLVDHSTESFSRWNEDTVYGSRKGEAVEWRV